MVIEDISTVSSCLKVKKTIDFLDEKIELKSDILKAIRNGIKPSECAILNLEENGDSCLNNPIVCQEFETSADASSSGDNVIPTVTYHEARNMRPRVLFILGATERTSSMLSGESFLGAHLTNLYIRKSPFSDILSKNLLSRRPQSEESALAGAGSTGRGF